MSSIQRSSSFSGKDQLSKTTGTTGQSQTGEKGKLTRSQSERRIPKTSEQLQRIGENRRDGQQQPQRTTGHRATGWRSGGLPHGPQRQPMIGGRQLHQPQGGPQIQQPGGPQLPLPNPNAVGLVHQNVQPQGTVRVAVPGVSTPVDLRLDIVPEQFRNDPNLGATLGAKIQRGGELFKNIQAGTIPDFMKPENAGNLTVAQQREKAKAVSDLAFFIQAQGEAKVGSFADGAFSLPDPTGNLAKFLTSYPNSYQRMSSHIGDIQGRDRSADKMNPGTEHYGLDLHDDGQHLDTVLPHGKGTILFGRVPADSLSTPDNQVTGDRLFFKMEDHGTGGGGTDRALHNPPGQAGGKLQKIKDFFGHAGGFIRSTFKRLFGDNSPAGTFKERIPGEVKRDYKAVIDACSGNRDIKAFLKEGDWGNDSKGFRVMMQNLTEAEERFQTQLTPDMKDAIAAFKQKYGDRPDFDHPAIRIGQEVILTDVELGGATLPPPVSAPLSPAVRGAMTQSANTLLDRMYTGTKPDGSQGEPNGAMIKRADVGFANPARLQSEQNMASIFARDVVRYDFTIGEGPGAIVGRDHQKEGGGLTEEGYDEIKGFFHAQYPGDPISAERDMRVVTSVCNQLLLRDFPGPILSSDPNGPCQGHNMFPLTQRHADASHHLTANPDGTYTMRVVYTKRANASDAEKRSFQLGSASSDQQRKLDFDRSDFRFEVEMKIDPMLYTIGEPAVSVTRMTGSARLFDTSGNLVYDTPQPA